MKGKRIVVEGIEGSGKSTTCQAIQDVLDRRENASTIIQSPGRRGPLGNLIHACFAGIVDIRPGALMHLFAAEAIDQDRWVTHNLAEGKHVLNDRHTILSAMAYQTDHHTLATVLACQPMDMFEPVDLLVFLDVDPQLTVERRRERAEQVTDGKYKTNDLDKLRSRRARYMVGLALMQESDWVKRVMVMRPEPDNTPITLAYQIVDAMGVKSTITQAVR